MLSHPFILIYSMIICLYCVKLLVLLVSATFCKEANLYSFQTRKEDSTLT